MSDSARIVVLCGRHRAIQVGSMILLTSIGLFACASTDVEATETDHDSDADDLGYLEDGQAGLAEGTAGWAVSAARPCSLDWDADAALVAMNPGVAFGMYADGTAGSSDGEYGGWRAWFMAPEKTYLLYVRAMDDGSCESYRGDPTPVGLVPIRGWRVNSDDLAIADGLVQLGYLSISAASTPLVDDGSLTMGARLSDWLTPEGYSAMMDAESALPEDHPIAEVTRSQDARTDVIDAVTGDILVSIPDPR